MPLQSRLALGADVQPLAPRALLFYRIWVNSPPRSCRRAPRQRCVSCPGWRGGRVHRGSCRPVLCHGRSRFPHPSKQSCPARGRAASCPELCVPARCPPSARGRAGWRQRRGLNPAPAAKYFGQGCVFLTSPPLVWCSEGVRQCRGPERARTRSCAGVSTGGMMGARIRRAGVSQRIKYFCLFFSLYANVSVEVESGQV